MERTAASAIVLAGGRSSRFGTDKMAADVDGVPLLHHAVTAAASACDEVLVVGAPSGLPVELPEGLGSVPVVVLDVDAYPGSAGGSGRRLRDLPAVTGCCYWLATCPRSCLRSPRRLLSWDAEHEGACLVIEAWPQPFPMGLDRAAVSVRGAALVKAGERSLRSLMRSLAIEQVAEAEWRALDPGASSLRDIDRPEDLSA